MSLTRVLRHVTAGAVAAGAACLLVVWPEARLAAQDWQPRVLDPHAEVRGGVCGTAGVRARVRGLRAPSPVRNGVPVSFVQDPAILTANHTGLVTLREFLVAGDVSTLRFKPSEVADGAPDTETWTRVGTRTVGDRTVSVFEPSWAADQLARVLSRYRWGWDYPSLYWGEVLPGTTEPGKGLIVTLRIAPASLPAVRVTRLSDTVQFSSHVVNLVIPDFGDRRLTSDESDFDFVPTIRKFYESFDDSYDSLAFIPQAVHLSDASAFHFNIRNDVRGIGEDLFDDSAAYGSAGRLEGAELFYQAAFGTNSTSVHEMSHQWGHYFDWTKLVGLPRAGHQPEAHDPLFFAGETYTGALLDGTRRVARVGDAFQVERTPAPIRFHPTMLYAMGMIGADQVPDLTLFDDQGQFEDNARPGPGTAVGGERRPGSVWDIIGMLGPREGPVPTGWSRATVVVSRGGLLSQREMDYWTFLAARAEDPQQTGVLSYEGFQSFDGATGNRVDLKTDIRPTGAERITQVLAVDTPAFAPTDFRGVVFDGPVPGVFTAAQRVRLTGRVTATDRSDFSQILIRFSRADSDQDVQVRAAVTSAGTFVADWQFEDAQKGRYVMQVYLFWNGAPAQYPRTSATVVAVR